MGAVTKKEKKIKDAGGCECKRRKKKGDNGSEGSDTTFSQTGRRRCELPSRKTTKHPDSDTVKKQSGKVTPQPQQCHEILFSVSWTALAVREREASVEQQRSSE